MTNTINIGDKWHDGQQVMGTYCGISFSGRIQDGDQPYCSRRTPHGRGFIFVVALDSPIVVFGQERYHVEIWQ